MPRSSSTSWRPIRSADRVRRRTVGRPFARGLALRCGARGRGPFNHRAPPLYHRAPPEAKPSVPVDAWVYDAENARDVMGTCASCHGGKARGGKNGTYPRIAGLDERCILRQRAAFRRRERINIPMYPYTTKRELPPDDARDVARLISQIRLPTELPEFTPEMSALERLEAAQSVFRVPPVKGDIARGGALYEDTCVDCHGEQGWGDDDVPQLAGQHIHHLRRQVRHFRAGERQADDMDGVFGDLTDADLEDIYAYLASRDD